MIKFEKLKFNKNIAVESYITRYENLYEDMVKHINELEEKVKKLESDLKIAQKDIHDLKYDGL